MKISIVIPTRNKGELLASRLRPLFHQTLPSDQYEIVVVNNASTDQTSEVLATLRREGENFRWVMEPVPGRPQARNRGIREAAGDLIVLLDDDIEVQPDHLERHLAYHTQATDRMAVVGHVVDVSPIQPAWVADYVLARQGMVARAPDAASAGILAGLRLATGNVSLLRSTLDRIRTEADGQPQYFDPSLPMRQDADLGFRLARAGVRFVFAHDIQCYHNHPRGLRFLWQRSYQVGHATVRLVEKHPQAVVAAKYLTASRLVNLGLLAAALGLFGPTFVLRRLWPEPFRKAVGAMLLYQTNRGYQEALQDQSRRPT